RRTGLAGAVRGARRAPATRLRDFKKMKLRAAWICLALFAAAIGSHAAEIAQINDGLSAAERTQFYHTAEGSEIFPLKWLRAMESSRTGKPFLENMQRFGLLADPENPDGLPIGLAAERTRDLQFSEVRMVGVTCAACHTGQLTYKGRALRIDGAPNR